jgi:hypothetical protein
VFPEPPLPVCDAPDPDPPLKPFASDSLGPAAPPADVIVENIESLPYLAGVAPIAPPAPTVIG